MFSLFKQKIDTSTPSKFKASILSNSVTISDLTNPKVFKSWSSKENSREYMEVLEGLAVQGNKVTQEFVANFFGTGAERSSNKDTQRAMNYKALKFGVLAAESGITAEALNVPVCALKLAGLLLEKNGQSMDAEVRSLVEIAYKWHELNSKNLAISMTERNHSAQKAQELKDAWPDLHSDSKKINDEMPNDRLEKAYLIITAMVLSGLGSNAPPAIHAKAMVQEALQEISSEKIVECNVDVAALFVLMTVAISAYEDSEKAMATTISQSCKLIASRVMQAPQNKYSDTEFSMIDFSIEAMKRIDPK